MKTMTLISLAFVFFCVFGSEGSGKSRAVNYSHSTTPVKVLLERSNGPLALQILEAASVRVDESLKAPRLLPGKLWIQAAGDGKIAVVRIPYLPLTASDFALHWTSNAPGFEFAGRQYRGSLRVLARRDALFVVNTVAMEDYLASTVGGEMSPSWPLEALKAQTVAARSYTVGKLRQPKDPLYDLEDTTEDQVYRGLETETLSGWDAVKQTDGLVLTRKGAPVTAYYHSRCGGETLTAEQAWGKRRTYSTRVPCAFCRKNPYLWSAQWDKQGFAKKVGLSYKDTIDVRPVSRNPAGRVLEIEVASGEEKRILSAEELRRHLGYTQLKSTLFEFIQEGGEIRASGLGAGHGVGMCQWGAKHLAEKGYSFERILNHYYPRERTHRWAPPQKSMDSSRVAGVWSAHDRFSAIRFPASRRSNRAFSSRTP